MQLKVSNTGKKPADSERYKLVVEFLAVIWNFMFPGKSLSVITEADPMQLNS